VPVRVSFAGLPELVEDLIRLQVAVIVTSGGEVVARMAKAATSTIRFLSLDVILRWGRPLNPIAFKT